RSIPRVSSSWIPLVTIPALPPARLPAAAISSASPPDGARYSAPSRSPRSSWPPTPPCTSVWKRIWTSTAARSWTRVSALPKRVRKSSIRSSRFRQESVPKARNWASAMRNSCPGRSAPRCRIALRRLRTASNRRAWNLHTVPARQHSRGRHRRRSWMPRGPSRELAPYQDSKGRVAGQPVQQETVEYEDAAHLQQLLAMDHQYVVERQFPVRIGGVEDRSDDRLDADRSPDEKRTGGNDLQTVLQGHPRHEVAEIIGRRQYDQKAGKHPQAGPLFGAVDEAV